MNDNDKPIGTYGVTFHIRELSHYINLTKQEKQSQTWACHHLKLHKEINPYFWDSSDHKVTVGGISVGFYGADVRPVCWVSQWRRMSSASGNLIVGRVVMFRSSCRLIATSLLLEELSLVALGDGN